jgi:catechol 2,3-dioxygenase-like lactoylglutathione lyase family enzyme
MTLEIERIDHCVLTVRDVDATVDFYTGALGMRLQVFGEGRKALTFGDQKLNLHQAGGEFEPKASVATPGSADLCFITLVSVLEAMAQLRNRGIEVLEGPVARTGALGPITSIYFRDPDGNLIELSNYELA